MKIFVLFAIFAVLCGAQAPQGGTGVPGPAGPPGSGASTPATSAPICGTGSANATQACSATPIVTAIGATPVQNATVADTATNATNATNDANGNPIGAVRVTSLPGSCTAGVSKSVVFASGSPLADANYTCQNGTYQLNPGGSTTNCVGDTSGPCGAGNTVVNLSSAAVYPNNNTAVAKNQVGATAGARALAAINALPSGGGLVDAGGELGGTWSSNFFSGVTKPVTLNPGGVGTINVISPVIIPSNVTLVVNKGTILSCSGSGSIQIEGSISAGEYQIFDPACPINFGGNVVLKSGTGSWWGMVGDNSTDNSTSFSAAWTALFKTSANGIPMTLPPGNFNYSTVQALYLGSPIRSASITGAGIARTLMNYTGTAVAAGIVFSYDATGSQTIANVKVQDIQFTGGGTATYAALFQNIARLALTNVAFGIINETVSTSACASFYNLTGFIFNQIQCTVAASWGTHIPVNGFSFDGVSPAVGATVGLVNNPIVSGVSDAAFYLGNGANISINQTQQSLCGRSFNMTGGWSNLTISGGNVGETDTNMTEDATFSGTGATIDTASFLSSGPVHVTGTNIKFSNTKFFGTGFSANVDSNAHQVSFKDVQMNSLINDAANDTTIDGIFNFSTHAPFINGPTYQRRFGLGTSGDPDQFVTWGGTWYASNAAPRLISTYPFSVSSAWRMRIHGAFLAGASASAADGLSYNVTELSNAVNTYTFSDGTVWTFSLNGSNQLQIVSSTSIVHGLSAPILEFWPNNNGTTNQSESLQGKVVQTGPSYLLTNLAGGNVIYTIQSATSSASPELVLQQGAGGPLAGIKSGFAAADVEVFTNGTTRLTIPQNGNPIVSAVSFQAPSYATTTNCSSTASPAVCVAAAAGQIQIAASATSIQINTTAVTANSRVGCLTYSTVGLTAPTNIASLVQPYLSAISAGVSLTLTIPVAPLVNPVNLQYCLIN